VKIKILQLRVKYCSFSAMKKAGVNQLAVFNAERYAAAPPVYRWRLRFFINPPDIEKSDLKDFLT
jgi:hypothetical protein